MKTLLLPPTALVLAAFALVSCERPAAPSPVAPSPAEESATGPGFFERIKADLGGPAVKGTPKFTALYFSAQWCGPCRMFTPKLVEWYNSFKPKHPDFELVFVSADRDAAAMQEYIKSDNMPWPYVQFDKAGSEVFARYGSDGIPYLVLLDSEGRAVTAKEGNEWQSPQEVLAQIEKIVGGG